MCVVMSLLCFVTITMCYLPLLIIFYPYWRVDVIFFCKGYLFERSIIVCCSMWCSRIVKKDVKFSSGLLVFCTFHIITMQLG